MQQEKSIRYALPTQAPLDNIVSLRAYGRQCCYPDLTQPQTWYEKLVPLLRPRLVNYLRFNLAAEHRSSIDDIVSDTINEGLREANAGNLRPVPQDVNNWLLVALKNNLKDYYRKDNRYREIFVTLDIAIVELAEPNGANPQLAKEGEQISPEAAYIAKLDVQDAVKLLTPLQALVATLTYLEGYTSRELAALRERALSSTTELIRATRANLLRILA